MFKGQSTGNNGFLPEIPGGPVNCPIQIHSRDEKQNPTPRLLDDHRLSCSSKFCRSDEKMALFIYDKNEQFLGVFSHVFSPTTPAQSEKTVRCHPIGSAMNGSVDDELIAAGKSTLYPAW